MKYKLIDLKTKEEHLCDKVTIDGFDYYVNDYISEEVGGDLTKIKINVLHQISVATTNPNIDISKVIDEAEKLAKELIHSEGVEVEILRTVWISGYTKFQETHPFSEEDMIEFLEWAEKEHWWKSTDARFPLTVGLWTKTVNGDFKYKDGKLTKELLQLWKEQKIKTMYYE